MKFPKSVALISALVVLVLGVACDGRSPTEPLPLEELENRPADWPDCATYPHVPYPHNRCGPPD